MSKLINTKDHYLVITLMLTCVGLLAALLIQIHTSDVPEAKPTPSTPTVSVGPTPTPDKTKNSTPKPKPSKTAQPRVTETVRFPLPIPVPPESEFNKPKPAPKPTPKPTPKPQPPKPSPTVHVEPSLISRICDAKVAGIAPFEIAMAEGITLTTVLRILTTEC